MGKAIRNYLLLLGLVVLLMMLTVFSSNGDGVDWSRNYQADSKQPYGLYILGEEMKHFFSKEVEQVSYTPYEYFRRHGKKGQNNYIFTLGALDPISLKALFSDIQAGSQALFLTHYYSLNDTLKIEMDSRYYIEEMKLQLATSSYNKMVPVEKDGAYDYLETAFFTSLDKARDKALGYVYFKEEAIKKKEINFIEVPYGKGKLYIYAGAPVAFTNYYLKSNFHLGRYAAMILSYLPRDRKTVWFADTYGSDRFTANNTLDFINQEPSLRITWRLLLLGFLLFLIFKGKRQQRIIPVIEKPKNTTIEFAQSISSLYYQERDATDMVRKKIAYFLDQVRQRYYLDTQQIDEAFAQRLANKSGRDRQLVGTIVAAIMQFEQHQQAKEETLIQLDKWIDEFWNIH